MRKEDKITHITINSQVLNNRLQDAFSMGFFSQKLKNITRNFLTELQKVEREYYDKFFEKKEDSVCDVYDVYDNFMLKIANVPIYDMENIGLIIDAYNKDKKSIEGIVNKILK